jgi:hypothetical protein
MTDPVFGSIEFFADAWDGVVPFHFEASGTTELTIHVWADESGPTEVQQETFRLLLSRYAMLWPPIAEALLGCNSELGSLERIGTKLWSSVGCYIESAASAGHSDFDLVYTFEDGREINRSCFVRIVGWRIVEAVIAE